MPHKHTHKKLKGLKGILAGAGIAAAGLTSGCTTLSMTLSEGERIGRAAYEKTERITGSKLAGHYVSQPIGTAVGGLWGAIQGAAIDAYWAYEEIVKGYHTVGNEIGNGNSSENEIPVFPITPQSSAETYPSTPVYQPSYNDLNDSYNNPNDLSTDSNNSVTESNTQAYAEF